MRDTTSTPIIRYDGPPELRKSLEMEGRKFLGYVKGVLGGGLPYQKYVGRYNDGTTIEVQSISHVGELDIIKITVPVGGEEIVVKEEKRKRVEVVVQETEQIIPLLLEIPDASKMDEQSICSWDSPNFKTFLYFFKTPTARPIYALITPSPEEITVREFKDVRDYESYIESNSDESVPSFSVSHTPNIPEAPDEWPEGSYNNIQFAYNGSWVSPSRITLPDGTPAIELSMTYSVNRRTEWGALGPNESDFYFERYIIYGGSYSLSGDSVREVLSQCYVNQNLYAVLFIKQHSEGSSTIIAQDNGWSWVYPGPPVQPEVPESPFDGYAGDTEINYGLCLAYCIDGEITEIELPPVWDDDTEWEVSQGYVAIYNEKVVVYSYLKTEKAGGVG